MKRLPIIAAAVAGLALLAGAATRSPKTQIARNLDIFNTVYKELQTFYVDSIDAEKSIATAINAMLSDIDPYTEYIPEKEQAKFRTMTSGEYGGIGSIIQQRPEGVIIAGPYDGSPAAKAGLRTGDLILTIDGDSVTKLDTEKVSERLKGPQGTIVHVSVKRPHVADSMLSFDIRREKIRMPSVPYWGMLPDGVGYIALNTFSEKSYPEVREATEKLLAGGAKSLILDLRGNGGGLVESAVQILGLYLPKGTTVLNTRGKG
ncbi:MAG: PDZ domain-containing protein, partial [Duncaniella sp.]|nr:PDZ domain-containing protein [Duncaniella sp.]